MNKYYVGTVSASGNSSAPAGHVTLAGSLVLAALANVFIRSSF
jgi:hypothetical protein